MATRTDADVAAVKGIKRLSVREIKLEFERLAIDCAGCLERAELE